MTEFLGSNARNLIEQALLVFAALFPIVNPVGGAPVFLAKTEGLGDAERAQLALRSITRNLKTTPQWRHSHFNKRLYYACLFLTNFYQIQGSGGEEQSCQQVVEGLIQRGHDTLVLTSMHGTGNMPVEAEADGVFRSLYLEMDLVPLRHSITFFTKRKAREKHNLEVLKRVVQKFVPDIIFIWGMWNLPYSLAAYAEARYPDKVVYRFATYWPTLPSQHEIYWRIPGRSWYSRLPKHETYLPAFRDLVVNGKAESVMCAYNSFRGQPACGSDELLGTVLRREWGFAGYVVSDCAAVIDIHASHKARQTPAAGAAMALLAGTDLECGAGSWEAGTPDSFPALADAQKQGFGN